MALLRIERLAKSFDGIKAVDDLSFTLKKGTITGLIGPNGAGKTTVFNILTGLCKADGGSIYLSQKPIFNESPYHIAHHGIGRTFQNIRLFPQITVWENLLLASRNHCGEHFFGALFSSKQSCLDENVAEENAKEYLEFVGLSDKKNQLAENLSHGQKKLLQIAMVLATRADLLLLDEPTAGVYPETRKNILGLLTKLRDQGKTILFIEHDMKAVMNVSDVVVVMDYGKKIAEGPPEQVRRNRDVIDAYLGRGNGSA